jgi:hypothetical protein
MLFFDCYLNFIKISVNNSLYSFTWHGDIVGDAGQALLPLANRR